MPTFISVIAYNFSIGSEDDVRKRPIAFETEGKVVIPAGVEESVLGGARIWYG